MDWRSESDGRCSQAVMQCTYSGEDCEDCEDCAHSTHSTHSAHCTHSTHGNQIHIKYCLLRFSKFNFVDKIVSILLYIETKRVRERVRQRQRDSQTVRPTHTQTFGDTDTETESIRTEQSRGDHLYSKPETRTFVLLLVLVFVGLYFRFLYTP